MRNFYAAGQRIREDSLLIDPAQWQSVLDGFAAEGTREVAGALATMEAGIVLSPGDALLGDGFDVSAALRSVDAQSDVLRAVLLRLSVDASVGGSQLAAAAFPTMPGYAAYRHEWAIRWAEKYSAALVTRINETTRQRLRQEIADWLATGAPISDLRDRLQAPGLFGLERAKLIAVTESTFAFTEGTFDFYEAIGLAPRPADRPPAHPGCRCFVGVAQDDGRLFYVWYTVVDDRVCPICQPRHLEIIGDAGPARGRSIWTL